LVPLRLFPSPSQITSPSPHFQPKWSTKSKLGGAVVAALFLGSVAISNIHHPASSSQQKQQLSSSAKPKLSVNRLGYDEVAEHTRSVVYGIDYVVEPDTDTILKVLDCEGCTDLSWVITPTSEKGSVTYDSYENGNTMKAVFTDANSAYSITVTQNGVELLSYDLTCKYVKRELRSVNEADLERYFKAMKTLYSTTQEEGEATYGKNFISYAHLTANHASDLYRYHSNLFFTTSHPVMQMRFEKSLLSIDPSVVLCYWDFMKDYKLGRNWADSEIYSDKMFGSIRTKEADSYRVTGYFHDVEYVYDPDHTAFPNSATNPHGFLGAAQMTSSSKYLQRGNSYCGFESVEGQVSGSNLVGCFDQYETESNLREFDICLEEKVHANLHMMHAGQWNCAVSWSDFYDENKLWVDDMFLSIAAVTMSTMTQVYEAYGYLSCPTSCDFMGDGDNSACKCESSLSDVSSADDVDSLSMTRRFDLATEAWSGIATKSVGAPAYMVFMKEYDCDGTTYSNVWLPADVKGDDATKPLNNEKLDKLNALILKTILFQGDYGIMMSGAAVNDPIFWVMHPMFDKAIQALRLSSKYNANGFEWNNMKSDMKFEGVTPFTKTDFEPYAAPSALAKLSDAKDGFLKNSELWDLLHPDMNAIGYVYDQFTEWGDVAFDPFEGTY
jgi:hypothetical protein